MTEFPSSNAYPSSSESSVSPAESENETTSPVKRRSKSRSASPSVSRSNGMSSPPARPVKLSGPKSPPLRQRKVSTASSLPKSSRARKSSDSYPAPRSPSASSKQVPVIPGSIPAKASDRKEEPVVTGANATRILTRPRRNPVWTALNIFKLMLSAALSTLQVVLSPVWSVITVAACFAVLLFFLYYLLRESVQQLLHPLSALSSISYYNPTHLYCSTIGYGCSASSRRKPTVAALARTVSEQATQAHDIFQSLSSMGNPDSLGLHFTEMWELAVAVSASSNLPNKEPLGQALKELGDGTRDVKDRLITINSIGINSFSWTVREFKRIEQTIRNIYQEKGKYTSRDVAKQLDSLFDRLAKNLDHLLAEIGSTIPKAERASMLGGDILEQFSIEQAALVEQKENTPLWKLLLDRNTFKGRQLSRDLDLAEVSIDNLKAARTNLEDARGFLLQYRDNVAYFKAGVIGFHLADHQLSPEDEVESLQAVMNDFQEAVDAAKRGGPVPRTERERVREIEG